MVLEMAYFNSFPRSLTQTQLYTMDEWAVTSLVLNSTRATWNRNWTLALLLAFLLKPQQHYFYG